MFGHNQRTRQGDGHEPPSKRLATTGAFYEDGHSGPEGANRELKQCRSGSQSGSGICDTNAVLAASPVSSSYDGQSGEHGSRSDERQWKDTQPKAEPLPPILVPQEPATLPTKKELPPNHPLLRVYDVVEAYYQFYQTTNHTFDREEAVKLG